MMYNPRQWYWKNSNGKIFSSGDAKFVEPSDAKYGGWLAAGYAPTPWPRDATGNQSTAALDAVLDPYGLSTGLTPPITK